MPEAGETLQGKVIGGKFHLGVYLGGSERSAVFLTQYFQGQHRTAAIKLIPADPHTADFQLSRWKLISRLTHPHLLQLFEAGRCQEGGDEMLYVVMEYAEEHLAQVLPQRSLTPDETNQMLKPVLEALAYLHGRGFVHGHLKPANILVAGEQLKLASDCLCRIGETDVADTGAYAPPDAPGTAASPARDIWSLGVTLVQVLTQLLPVRNGAGVTLPETLPPQFLELAQNCLQPNPQRRCTLAEMAGHLHYKLPARTIGPPSLPSEQSRAQPPGLRSNAREARKNRSAVPAAAILFALVAVVAGWNLFHRTSSQPDSAKAVEEQTAPQQAAPAPPMTARNTASPQPPHIANTAPVASPRATRSRESASLKTASAVSSVAPPASQPLRSESTDLKPRGRSSPGVLVPGEVVQQELPQASRDALNTIRGTVRVTVRARVDPAGNVAGVDMVSAGPSRYFARLAADAARQWRFSAAQRDGQAVASQWTIRFEFVRTGVQAIPAALP
jgi:TonB family protein